MIPDIVTMAKGFSSNFNFSLFIQINNYLSKLGIGNGFPMAAVVTTPEIADTLAQVRFKIEKLLKLKKSNFIFI